MDRPAQDVSPSNVRGWTRVDDAPSARRRPEVKAPVRSLIYVVTDVSPEHPVGSRNSGRNAVLVDDAARTGRANGPGTPSVTGAGSTMTSRTSGTALSTASRTRWATSCARVNVRPPGRRRTMRTSSSRPSHLTLRSEMPWTLTPPRGIPHNIRTTLPRSDPTSPQRPELWLGGSRRSRSGFTHFGSQPKEQSTMTLFSARSRRASS
jgi:hypothetical protein